MRKATFHISEPIEIIGLNKNSDINNPIRKRLNMLYSDMINEQDCRLYGSRLSAMDGLHALHDIDHKNGTLVIKGIDKLDYFFGGISAITEPFLSNSKRTFEQLKFKRQILMWFKFGILGFIVFIVLSFLL